MQSTRNVRVGIVGTGQRASAFVKGFRKLPGVELKALCDVDRGRLEAYAEQRDCRDVRLFTDLAGMLAGDLVDAVVVTVPDYLHRQVALECFAAGKHLMLEKPMALTVDDCKDIIRAKLRSGRVLQVGFVLRCTPFYRKVKELVDSGVLGQIMGISAAEYLSTAHSASYMRRWHRKSANSGSFMLTKCSHDLDLLNWIAGSQAWRVASFGANNFFLPAKRPASHCSKCAEPDCRFRFNPDKGSFVFMTPADRANPAGRDFDLCVYNDDKDLVDNQVAIIEYANGVRADFSLQLFRAKGARTIAISGSEAYLTGCLEDNRITVLHARTGQSEVHEIAAAASGHAGGDEHFIREFVEAVRDGAEPPTDLRAGLASTVVGVAIETARTRGTVIAIAPDSYEWETISQTANRG